MINASSYTKPCRFLAWVLMLIVAALFLPQKGMGQAVRHGLESLQNRVLVQKQEFRQAFLAQQAAKGNNVSKVNEKDSLALVEIGRAHV